MAFVIRAGALWKTDDKQGALEASARAFTCMCGVESADVQLMIFDQLGTLLLETGYAQKAAVIVGQTPRSARVPLDPLFANGTSFLKTRQADEGVGCGPGGPPH